MSVPLKKDDPAYWMLQQGLDDPEKRSKPEVAPDPDCYICQDPEFALMGLPLCKACPWCTSKPGYDGSVTGHVPADDTICTVCGKDIQEWYEQFGPQDEKEPA